MKSRIIAFCFTVILIIGCQTKESSNNLISDILKSDNEKFSHVLENLDKHEIQVLYTQINRDENNEPSFNTHKLNVNTDKYFYPASSVKLYAAILALQKLNEINIQDLDKFTALKIDSSFSGQSSVTADSTSKDNLPSIAHYIKKLFLVSDNDAYNRLFEFCGQQYLNEELWKRGFENTKLFHRLSVGLTLEENRNTNPFTFYEDSKVIYKQNALYNENEIKPYGKTLKGKGFIKGDSLINKPMDFTYKNYTSLTELQMALKNIVFPESAEAGTGFNLKEQDFKFLQKTMSMFPRESDYPKYDKDDNYVKFFLFEKDKNKPGGKLRFMSKIGMAYGYLIENSYVYEIETGVEYLLSAVISVNENQIYNDNKYEYKSIGFPFFEDLNRAIYMHELERKKVNKPDLSEFTFD